MTEINARVAQAIIAAANLVQARRAVWFAQKHLTRCADAHDTAWGRLDPDELHEANMCVLAGMEIVQECSADERMEEAAFLFRGANRTSNERVYNDRRDTDV
jgi:hypothetical protein